MNAARTDIADFQQPGWRELILSVEVPLINQRRYQAVNRVLRQIRPRVGGEVQPSCGESSRRECLGREPARRQTDSSRRFGPACGVRRALRDGLGIAWRRERGRKRNRLRRGAPAYCRRSAARQVRDGERNRPTARSPGEGSIGSFSVHPPGADPMCWCCNYSALPSRRREWRVAGRSGRTVTVWI